MAKFLARFLKKDKSAPTTSQASKIAFGIGTTIKQRYRLDVELGRGGMGIVYRAHDISNDRDVAVKVIDANKINPLTMGQFLRESKIAAQLRHPHIITTYEIGSVDDGKDQSLPFIVMELLQGASLTDVHGFTYARIIDIGKQICDALAYIHDQGFLYRDLKPANVILEKCGFHYCVKLFDFGLARPRYEAYLPNESTRAGTVFYLAPELIAGQTADIGADLYALGATLYEMITGRVPFSDIDEQTILTQHLDEKVSPPSNSRNDVPPELESIVLRLLEKHPVDRFASAQEVLGALEQVKLQHASSPRGNLPQTNSSTHESETEQIIHLLESNQLVTLLNDDEALALAVGVQLINEFADGVWLVKLETIHEPVLVLPTVASILGVTEPPNRPLTLSLIEALREKNLLLLLNHCGPLRAACAQLVETVLHACPEVYILATSDQPLNSSSEKCFQPVTKNGS